MAAVVSGRMRAAGLGVLAVLGMGCFGAAYVRGYRPEVVRVRGGRVHHLVTAQPPAAPRASQPNPASHAVVPTRVTTTTIPVFAGSSVTALYHAPVTEIIPPHYPLAGNGLLHYPVAGLSVSFQLQGVVAGGGFVVQMESGPQGVVVAASRNGRLMMAGEWLGTVTLTNLSAGDAVFRAAAGGGVQWFTVNLVTGLVRESVRAPLMAEVSTNIAGIAGTYPAPVITPLHAVPSSAAS